MTSIPPRSTSDLPSSPDKNEHRAGNRSLRFAMALGLLLPAALGFMNLAAPSSGTSKGVAKKNVDGGTQVVGDRLSCSARGCHGRTQPRTDGGPGLNESHIWLLRDPHSTAFDVLFSERSREIGEALHGDQGPAPHRDDICLACHDTPAATVAAGGQVGHWQNVGVTCNACHQAAETWLREHVTLPQDARARAAKMARIGMPPLHEPTTAGAVCAGCHVGAPADTNAPVRDVNHDLIAAGHPRLHFDLPSFLDAMPTHWTDAGPKAKPLVAWAAGQRAAVLAQLRLLVDRSAPNTADSRPWPELAELSCFDCHHDLLPRGFSRPTDGPNPFAISRGRPHWNHPRGEFFPEALAVLGYSAPESAEMLRTLEEVQNRMSGYAPDAVAARTAAEAALATLSRPPQSTQAAVTAVRDGVLRRLNDKNWRLRLRWDDADQLQSLSAAFAEQTSQPDLASAADQLLNLLLLPGRARDEPLIDSPANYQVTVEETEALNAALEELQRAWTAARGTNRSG